MPRTRLSCREALAGALGLAVCMACMACAAVPLPLTCTLHVPAQGAAGQPLRLELSLRNTGTQALDVLVWGTPFEPAWFAPWVSVWRDGLPLTYAGAKLKRGEPGADDYLHFDAGQARRASFELAPAFDVGLPGRYRVLPQLVLHDVVVAGAAAVPRPRERHAARALDCNAAVFDILP